MFAEREEIGVTIVSQAKVSKIDPKLTVLGVVFIGLHIPLVSMAVLFLAHENPSAMAAIGTGFLSTVVAAIFTLGIVWLLLRAHMPGKLNSL